MKRHLILLILITFAIHLQAQQMISVIDDDTRQPVCHATFIQDGDTIAYTSPEGIAIVPKLSGKVIVCAQDYKSVEFNADSIPAVIRIKCEIERLEEILVIGDKNKIVSKFQFGKDVKPLPGGGVGMGIDAIFRAMGYRPASEKRRERVKKNLEAYDKTAPPLPTKVK